MGALEEVWGTLPQAVGGAYMVEAQEACAAEGQVPATLLLEAAHGGGAGTVSKQGREGGSVAPVLGWGPGFGSLTCRMRSGGVVQMGSSGRRVPAPPLALHLIPGLHHPCPSQ